MRKEIEDIVMMDKVQKLWDAGHQEELAYFGLKCVEAYQSGMKEARTALCKLGLFGGALITAMAYVSKKKIDKKLQKLQEKLNDEE